MNGTGKVVDLDPIDRPTIERALKMHSGPIPGVHLLPNLTVHY